MQRAVPLPIPAAEVRSLDARRGKVYYFTQPIPTIDDALPGEKATLHVYDMKKRKDAVVVEDLDSYRVSADGRKVLYKKDEDWTIVDAKPADDREDDDEKPVDVSNLRMRVEPPKEWHEMFESAWRLERDFFYNREDERRGLGRRARRLRKAAGAGRLTGRPQLPDRRDAGRARQLAHLRRRR